jgi:hypothetical protein
MSSITNRRTWTLTTNTPGVCARLVQYVEPVDIAVDGGCFVLTFDGRLCCGEVYVLSNSAASQVANEVIFTGICVDDNARAANIWEDDGFLRDIANPSLPADALMDGIYLALGTYEITDSGDLAQDSGLSSLRKRILRRISTVLGGFYHLPGYGVELEEKRLLRPDLLRRIQDKLRAQILREPEVTNASVTLRQATSTPDTLSVIVEVGTAAGAQLRISQGINL